MSMFSTSSGYKPGGIHELLKLALPAGISQASFSIMMLTDRFLLTPFGKAAPAASMLAGFVSFLLTIFFFGMLNYITPLVAQYIGAKEESKVVAVVHQGLLICLISYPFILLFGELGISFYLEWMGIHPEQKLLAEQYFTVINVSALFAMVNIVMSSFFSGLGRTYVVMLINVSGMLINIPLSYWLVNYGISGLFVGVQGAALGSSLSVLFMTLLFLFVFLSKKYRLQFETNLRLRWNKLVLRKLLYFGSPSGFEMLLTFVAFTSFVALYHSYGVNEALAATIVFNWDIAAFMPVWGISIGLMSLVGKYMGAGRVDYALNAVRSGAIASFSTMFIASVLFFTLTDELVGVFLPPNDSTALDLVAPLAGQMLRLVSLYCFANAANLVLSGALRAAGDTTAVMYIATSGHWLMLICAICSVRVWNLDPIYTWGIFVSTLFFQTILFGLRYKQGVWKTLKVV